MLSNRVGGDESAVSQPTRTACVYTTLMGGYEKLNEQPVAASSRLAFICLTDNAKLESETWQVINVQPMFAMDTIRSQRLLKLRPHDYLPGFDCSLYIDNSVVLKVAPERLIDQHTDAGRFCLPQHSYRDSLLDEFLIVESEGLDDRSRIFEQLNHYLLEMPDVLQERPFWTGIMLRDHRDPQVRAMLEIWSAHMQRYSCRDQLSVNFALRRAGLRPQALQIDNFESWLHSWPHIIESERQNVRRLSSKFFSMPVARVKELERQLEESKLQYDNVLKSTSWRVTAPMRAAITAIRRLGQSGKRRWPGPARASTFMQRPARGSPHLPASGGVSGSEASEVEQFFQEGFLGPLDLFTPAQCQLILKHYRLGARPVSAEWPKTHAVSDRFFYDIAARPALLALLRPLLGDDVVLWGANVIERAPGQMHAWHTDIESSAPEGRFVSVWIGLANTCRESALQLISRTHRFGRPIQQEVHERRFRRGEATDDTVLVWAREHEPLAELIQPDMREGQALLFDGRLWHASHNRGQLKRAALLLQYAAAGTPVRIPMLNHVEWPFRFTGRAAPTVVVSGRARGAMPPPSACPREASAITTQLHCGGSLSESAEGWIAYPRLHGPTPVLAAMESHVSVLSPAHSPHPPHCHVEEELLIVLKGEAEILIADSPDPTGSRIERLGAGSFVYYPAYQYHTIRNTSPKPVTYLMFKWQGAAAEIGSPLPTRIFDIGGSCAEPNPEPMSMRTLFESSTGYLDRLHAHVTDLQPGAGYRAHADEYDIAIVVFSGVVETLGKSVGPGGSIYYAAGEQHGLRNVGHEPARYLVFEFHGPKPW